MVLTNNKKKMYLCTTGLSEVWDLNSDIVLLGPWCLKSNKNKDLLRDHPYIQLPSPFKPAIKLKTAGDYCCSLYKSLIPELSEKLNNLHNTKYPTKFWRILIGPWILNFIEVLFERYTRVLTAKKMYPYLHTTAIPSKDRNIVCLDTYDFNNKTIDDYFNLKLFSAIARHLNLNIDESPDHILEKYEIDVEKAINDQVNNILRSSIKKILNKGLFYTQRNKKIILSDMYHLSIMDIKSILFDKDFREIGMRFFIPESYGNLDDFNARLRSELTLAEPVSDNFESLLNKLIPYAIPICYIENFFSIQKKAADSFTHYPVAVGSAIGWDCNEELKSYMAETVVKGTKCIDFQHGGGYGIMLVAPYETISLEKDIFYTWGWDSKAGNTLKLPSPHLSKIKNTFKQKTDKVLFVGTYLTNYSFRIETCLQPDDVQNYIKDKRLFIEELNDNIRNKIIYRPYQNSKEEIDLVKEISPEIKFAMDGKLTDWMKKVKLVVIDHPHTSFLEALTINVPTILFWDPTIYLVRPEVADYFENLRKAGILFDDPKNAAQKINAIYENSETWWNQSHLTETRLKFSQKLALTSDNWKKDWSNAFNDLIISSKSINAQCLATDHCKGL